MKTWAYILNGIAAVGGLVLGGGLCFLSLAGLFEQSNTDQRFFIMLGVCGVIHILLPWVGIVFLRRHTTTGYQVSLGISVLSLLLSAGLLWISGALLFGIANP
jgi:hypothetical protein